MNIMVVDDSVTMRKVVTLALKAGSYEYEEACDGEEALEKMKKSKYDFFLVDVNMPGINGINLVKEIRKTNNYMNTPIVMLTTESEESMKNEGKAAGVNDWIVKPFKREELINIIKKNT